MSSIAPVSGSSVAPHAPPIWKHPAAWQAAVLATGAFAIRGDASRIEIPSALAPSVAHPAGLSPASLGVGAPPASGSAASILDRGLPSSPASPCPEDMVHVATSYCPDIERRCVDIERDDKNNIDICHAFSHSQSCKMAERPLDFCIDRYEYPNEKDAHPAWMLSWYQAQATCESKGKRLCWASEWTAACEGPDHTPFPYGWERDHGRCNIDNFWIGPRKPGPRAQFYFYSRDPYTAGPELARLDQSVLSGSMPSCKSGFGAFDMTGNMDEWVTSDQPPHERSKWAGLKGGAWGHVRNQCRPMTTSHEPEFTYYFVGFRCCQDVEGAPSWTPSPGTTPAPAVEADDFAWRVVASLEAPGPSKTKFTRNGHRE